MLVKLGIASPLTLGLHPSDGPVMEYPIGLPHDMIAGGRKYRNNVSLVGGPADYRGAKAVFDALMHAAYGEAPP
jgi:hypothetical protein